VLVPANEFWIYELIAQAFAFSPLLQHPLSRHYQHAKGGSRTSTTEDVCIFPSGRSQSISERHRQEVEEIEGYQYPYNMPGSRTIFGEWYGAPPVMCYRDARLLILYLHSRQSPIVSAASRDALTGSEPLQSAKNGRRRIVLTTCSDVSEEQLGNVFSEVGPVNSVEWVSYTYLNRTGS
jgi:hypothetical protein